jgi:hypothetical protein
VTPGDSTFRRCRQVLDAVVLDAESRLFEERFIELLLGLVAADHCLGPTLRDEVLRALVGKEALRVSGLDRG